jgi:hypothetical protein
VKTWSNSVCRIGRSSGVIGTMRTAWPSWAAVRVGGRLCSRGSPAGSGSVNASRKDLWVALLDGGVGIEGLVHEHHTTNHVSASQRTTIRGNAAFRAVTRSLGFDHLPRKLSGELALPDVQALDLDLAQRLAGSDCERTPP